MIPTGPSTSKQLQPTGGPLVNTNWKLLFQLTVLYIHALWAYLEGEEPRHTFPRVSPTSLLTP